MKSSGVAPCQCHSPGVRENGVARAQSDRLPAARLHQTAPVKDVQRLAQGMRVPRVASARREAHHVHAHRRRPATARELVDPYLASEDVSSALARRLLFDQFQIGLPVTQRG